ncbi:MAG TPA: hypothetical protein VF576_03875 [Rubricoccaceae bacterium]|jgi:hypothetical protein
MRTLLFAALVASAGLAGCARGVTIDDAYGRPDATEWTYFEGPAQTVVDAIARYYSIRDVATESARDESGGIVLTLAPRSGSADVGQILVQATNVEGFQSRAQVYPTRRPLPRDLEIGVTRDL